jgi:uncharacterized protein
MIDSELLRILRCPKTQQGLRAAEGSLIDSRNQRIAAGKVRHRAGQPVQKKIGGGLVRADEKLLYPIHQDIPVMLVDEAIPLSIRFVF